MDYPEGTPAHPSPVWEVMYMIVDYHDEPQSISRECYDLETGKWVTYERFTIKPERIDEDDAAAAAEHFWQSNSESYECWPDHPGQDPSCEFEMFAVRKDVEEPRSAGVFEVYLEMEPSFRGVRKDAEEG